MDILSAFNNTIDQWIAALDGYTLDMLYWRPGPRAWSLGQVYVHIIADTGFFVEQMDAALSSSADASGTMHANAAQMFAVNAFPDMALENPSNDPDLRQPSGVAELRDGLLRLRLAVNERCASPAFWVAAGAGVVADASGGFLGGIGKTRHPGLGFFTALEWLQFAEMHMRHHFRQKARIDELLFKK